MSWIVFLTLMFGLHTPPHRVGGTVIPIKVPCTHRLHTVYCPV